MECWQSRKIRAKEVKDMKVESALFILRLVLCNERVVAWLREEAEKTSTPIDNIAIDVIQYVLCGRE